MSCHEISCHVMWCHVMSCHVMWYDVIICGIMWCDMMWCDNMWCHVMSCHVMWCHVMWYDVIICDVMWCTIIVLMTNLFLLLIVIFINGESLLLTSTFLIVIFSRAWVRFSNASNWWPFLLGGTRTSDFRTYSRSARRCQRHRISSRSFNNYIYTLIFCFLCALFITLSWVQAAFFILCVSWEKQLFL